MGLPEPLERAAKGMAGLCVKGAGGIRRSGEPLEGGFAAACTNKRASAGDDDALLRRGGRAILEAGALKILHLEAISPNDEFSQGHAKSREAAIGVEETFEVQTEVMPRFREEGKPGGRGDLGRGGGGDRRGKGDEREDPS